MKIKAIFQYHFNIKLILSLNSLNEKLILFDITFINNQQEMKKIGIIGAMQEEIDYLIESMKSMEQKDQFFVGNIGEYKVVLVKSGIGKVNAALTAQRLITEFQVELVINTGIAGAMHSGLNMLDFVVSKDAVYHDFDVTAFGYKPTQIPRMETSCFSGNVERNQKIIKCFEKIQDSDLFKGHKIIEGRIATGDQFISDMETKQYIIDICDPACVEMEGTAIAHACRYNKIPFVIIRCMSDCADQKGHEKSKFNEHLAAKMSATLVREVLEGDNN